MSVEYVMLGIMAAFFLGYLLNLKQVDGRALTDEQIFFANVREPRFYTQRDATEAAALSAISEFEHCLKMLRETGNGFVKESDVHLFIYRANVEKRQGAAFPATDFAAFEAQAKAAEMAIRDAFVAQKQSNMKNAPAAHAKAVWGVDEN